MKVLHLTYLILLINLCAFSQTLSAVDKESKVQFKIRNLGMNVTGSFTGLQGKMSFDEKNLGSSFFEANIDAATINTGIDARNKHLRDEEYFDVKNFPRISFVSTKVTASTKAGTFFLFGKLTIKNTTRDISFPFTATPQQDGLLFNGEFKLNRRDFGVGGNSLVLSDNLTVQLAVLAKK
jgi:polyisoprenoid-binding protein YceI